jgi:uncharacterized protein (AIM24 family)
MRFAYPRVFHFLSTTFRRRAGFILQKLEGDGMAFVHAGGTIIRRELNNETIRLDTGCLVAFTQGISFDVMLVKGLKTMFLGGEGLFLAVLKGTGTIWMQSLPFSRMADRIIQSAPSAGGRRVGEGSALTGRVGGKFSPSANVSDVMNRLVRFSLLF